MQFISQGSLLAGPLFAGIVIGKMSDLISGGSIILITIVILE